MNKAKNSLAIFFENFVFEIVIILLFLLVFLSYKEIELVSYRGF